MNPQDVRTAPMQVSFRGAQLAAENAARLGSHALPAYTSAQVAAMARARLEGPAVKRPTLEMTTAVVITALVGLVVMGLGLMASGAFLGSRVIGLGLVVLGVVQLALIFHSRQLGARIGTTASGGSRLRDAGLCGSCAATLRPGALACEICGAPTTARDASGAIVSGVPVSGSSAGTVRAGLGDPPLAASTVELLRPSIWIYDGLERAVPAAARLPFVAPSNPEVAKRWGEARATLEQRAAGMFPRAVAFFALAALLIMIAAMSLAYQAFGASIVLAFAIVYLLTRAWIQLSSGRIAADRIREEFLSRYLCPCCASDLNVVGEHVSSGREATRCAACDCMWYPLHGEMRFFAKRITACRWCGYGTAGLIPDERGIICCPECGKRGVGPLHVECGKCGALVPITREENTKGWTDCVNCGARNQLLRLSQATHDARDQDVHDDAGASGDDANSV